MEIGDQIQMTGKYLVAIESAKGSYVDALNSFAAAGMLLTQARDNIFAVIRECYPELNGHEFVVNHQKQVIMIMQKKDLLTYSEIDPAKVIFDTPVIP
jgi:hypothetical protein